MVVKYFCPGTVYDCIGGTRWHSLKMLSCGRLIHLKYFKESNSNVENSNLKLNYACFLLR